MKWRIGILMWAMLNIGCSEQQDTVPTYKVVKSSLDVVVPASGELEAASAKKISSPGRQPMTIAWLAEEYKEVKKGELIAKFDGEQLSIDSRKEQLDIALIEKDVLRKSAEKSQLETELTAEKELVGQEFDFAKSFTIDDLRIYSQLEIIESMENTDFLSAKDEFLDWKQGSIQSQNQSAVEVLDIRKQGHNAKLIQHQQALALLEVRAPFDGLLVFEKNWRGESSNVGDTVFPGRTIAKIPNLEKMLARLFVLEKEAIGLAKGQHVEMTLDALPDERFYGTIIEVSGFARTIERGSPVKYFEVTVGLEQAGDEVFRPGRKMKANIQVENYPAVVAAPIQAIHNEDGNNYVYLKKGNAFIKQIVETGVKNLYLVEVVSGLSEGDEIALSIPEGQKNG